MARLEVSPPTKEFFIPATGGYEAYSPEPHIGYLINADGEYANMEFMIPHDFHKLINAELVWIAGDTLTNMFLKGEMCYGRHGESYEAPIHECNVTRTTVTDNVYRDDVSAGLAEAAPLDIVGYSVSRPALGNANATILGIRVRYV